MLMLKNITKLLLISFLSFKSLLAADIPVIVISPGKTAQSYDKVGSSVSVIGAKEIEESSSFFISDIIANNTTSSNLFKMGGYGTNTGIQIRGLEKRYSTVYIDGVKMSDPSSSDNSFYMENIMKSSIDRVEILKGTQSSLYGSNAIGGTIHIFTKKGKEERSSNIEIETGSNNTKSIFYSLDGEGNNINYYIGLNKFLTDGISAMNHNDERDKYKNEGIIGTVGYKFNKNFKLENSIRYTSSVLKYDEPSSSTTDLNNNTDNIEGTYSLKLSYDENKFKNTLSYNKTYIERAVTSATNAYTNYFGFRDNISLGGEYNFNLDNKLVYGTEAEFDAARYPSDYAPSAWNWKKRLMDKPADEHIFSQYFDYQFRPLENLYSTIGLRSDEHSLAGRKKSGRATLAYKLGSRKKIRSSFGAGIRFPSLYDYHYADGNTASSGGGSVSGDGYTGMPLEELKAERGVSYDLGYDTSIKNLNLNLTYFNVKQKNPLVSDSRNNWKMRNENGVNISKGIELVANWRPKNKKIGIDLNYTFTDSFDSSTCDVGDCTINGSKLATAKVRVPIHALTTKFTYNTKTNLQNSLLLKFVDETRDFGNTNNNFKDVILDDYLTLNFSSTYKLFDNYKLYFDAINLLDQNYEQAYQYSSMGRTLNFGIKRVY